MRPATRRFAWERVLLPIGLHSCLAAKAVHDARLCRGTWPGRGFWRCLGGTGINSSASPDTVRFHLVSVSPSLSLLFYARHSVFQALISIVSSSHRILSCLCTSHRITSTSPLLSTSYLSSAFAIAVTLTRKPRKQARSQSCTPGLLVLVLLLPQPSLAR